jgi:amidase
MRVVQGYLDQSRTHDLRSFMLASAARTTHQRAWSLFLQEHPLVLTPLSLQPSHPPDFDLLALDAFGDLLRSFVFQLGLNTLALPCAVVPTGLHRDRPIGVQLVASRYREDVALDAAEAVEARAGVLAQQLWARPAGA